ncbi:F-box protein CPR1-like [Lycium ferocissimum]|uniref:F-box protein CPR1-like n=1 Tax=Lycium ferocissimum TaxID=112874 RepID=UPI002815ABFD|nr:F-box protein CPR1-like [Lycium ferocissimum]
MADGIMKKLPEEVPSYILSRLTVKSLIRYRCISKIWYTLLQSSYFINLHIKRPTTTKDQFILFKRSLRDEEGKFKSLLSFLCGGDDSDDLIPITPNIEVPYLCSSYASLYHSLIGPCNGLIVLTDTQSIVLLNPATRKYNLLQPSPFGCPQGLNRYVRGLGFGFDLTVNNYKVVRISEIYSDPYKDPCVRGFKVEIYDLDIDSWREQNYEEEELPLVFRVPCSEIFYKGVVHWFATADTEVILCFDMSTDTFRNMKMPDTCYVLDGKRYGLVIFDESLTLICYRDPTCEIDPTVDMMDIWTMKDYGVNDSWIKLYTIRPLSIESPLTVWKDLLLLQSRTGQLISYNFISDEVKEFNLHGYPSSLRVIVYKESLTSVPKENGQGTQAQGI